MDSYTHSDIVLKGNNLFRKFHRNSNVGFKSVVQPDQNPKMATGHIMDQSDYLNDTLGRSVTKTTSSV